MKHLDQEEQQSQLDARGSVFQDDWWLEHLEDETDPGLNEDLARLLENSPMDREIVESLQETRRLIEMSDDVALPESGEYYDKLHDKIMASLDTAQPLPKSQLLRQKNFMWTALSGSLGLATMMVFVSWMSFSQKSPLLKDAPVSHVVEHALDKDLEVEARFEQMMIASAMTDFKTETDILSDLADQRLQGLTDDQVDTLLRGLTR